MCMKNTLFMHILLVTDLLPLLLSPTTQPVRVLVKQTLKDLKKDRGYVKYFSTINYFFLSRICIYVPYGLKL